MISERKFTTRFKSGLSRFCFSHKGGLETHYRYHLQAITRGRVRRINKTKQNKTPRIKIFQILMIHVIEWRHTTDGGEQQYRTTVIPVTVSFLNTNMEKLLRLSTDARSKMTCHARDADCLTVDHILAANSVNASLVESHRPLFQHVRLGSFKIKTISMSSFQL